MSFLAKIINEISAETIRKTEEEARERVKREKYFTERIAASIKEHYPELHTALQELDIKLEYHSSLTTDKDESILVRFFSPSARVSKSLIIEVIFSGNKFSIGGFGGYYGDCTYNVPNNLSQDINNIFNS